MVEIIAKFKWQTAGSSVQNEIKGSVNAVLSRQTFLRANFEKSPLISEKA